MKNSKTAIVFTLFFLLSLNVSAQNKFEGYNIIVDAPDTQTVAACAIRYVPPSTDVTITDLDRSTPLKISGCNNSNVKQTGRSAQGVKLINVGDNDIVTSASLLDVSEDEAVVEE